MNNNFYGDFDKEGFNDESIDGFHIVYAKSGSIPKYTFYKNRIDVVEFMINNLNSIDLLSINNVVIDQKKLVNENKKLSRYLKLSKSYEL
jgi:hypothetical protein